MRARTKFDFRWLSQENARPPDRAADEPEPFQSDRRLPGFSARAPRRGQAAVPRPADQRDQFLPRSRGVPGIWRPKCSPRSSVPRRPMRRCASGVAGCATGEEAYSLGMLLLEQLAAARKSCQVQIFATDVDEDALEVARQGIYPESIVTRCFARAAGAILHAHGRRRAIRSASNFANSCRCPPEPDHRRAVFQTRSHRLPQPADLPRAGGPEEGHRALAFCAQRGRLPVPGPVGDDWPAHRSVRAGLQEMADLPAHRSVAARTGRDSDRHRRGPACSGAAIDPAGQRPSRQFCRHDAPFAAGPVRAGGRAHQPEIRGPVLRRPHGSLPRCSRGRTIAGPHDDGPRQVCAPSSARPFTRPSPRAVR